MRFAGRLLFWLLLPAVRLVIGRTTRAYLIVASGPDILMVKGWFGRQKWHLPGGGIHKHETPQAAALRELHEETGLRLTNVRLKVVCSGRWRTDHLGYKYTVFLCQIAEKPTLIKRPAEILEAGWINPHELTKRNCDLELRAAIERAVLV